MQLLFHSGNTRTFRYKSYLTNKEGILWRSLSFGMILLLLEMIFSYSKKVRPYICIPFFYIIKINTSMRVRPSKVCIILLFQLIFSSAFGQSYPYYFSHYGIREGLSQNTVNAIIQDKTGFIWIGTKDGLNRFDGFTFLTFKREIYNKHSIGNNYIKALYEDTSGKIWVGTDAGMYVYDPDKEQFTLFTQQADNGAVISKTISSIEGNGEYIWIAVESQGVFCYDLHSGRLINYDLNKFNISSNIESLKVDKNGILWLGSYGEGLFFSKDNLKTVFEFKNNNNEQTFHDDIILKIIQGAYNCLYVGSVKGGLREVNLSSHRTRDLLQIDNNNEKIFIRDIIANSDNELWLGSESGIYIYNLRTNNYQHLESSFYDSYSLSDNAIYSLYKDREYGIWIGSYFGGLNYYPKQYTHFNKYYPTDVSNGLRGKRVREFCADPSGLVWISTEDGGLSSYNPHTNKISFFEPSKAFTNVQCLLSDGADLWVGTFAKGVKVINRNTGQIKSYTKGNSQNSLNDDNVFAMYRTSDGSIYLGTLFGLFRYNKSSDNFTEIKELNGKFIYDIKEDTRGNLWLATYADGVFCFDVNTSKWKNYQHNENDPKSLPYNKVTSIFEDSRHQIWITTQGRGFCKFDSTTESFTKYDAQNGLPNEVIYQIVEDNNGLFWVTSNKGLICFNPSNNHIKTYTVSDGILSNQFNYRSGFKSEDGSIFMGSINGFIKFDPKDFSTNKYIPTAVITDLLLFNKRVSVGEQNSPLKKSITYTDSLVLNSEQNSFGFRVAALSYLSPHINILKYKLDGFDNDWLPVTESPLINYSNLKYGDYTFRLKISEASGFSSESEKTIFIRILPPFYLSIWAYTLYILIFLFVLNYIVYNIKKRTARRERRAMEKFEQQKALEIYDAKIRFFTDVAHEIRTPLTLIKGPLDNILLVDNIDEAVREDLNIMNHNTDRLLNLTNQLLDFRKVESKGFQLNFKQYNISDILQGSYLQFKLSAVQKHLDFSLIVPESEVYAHIDKEAFTKIISNLFSNAIKYAQTYIIAELSLDKEKNELRITVKSDGNLIPAEVREEIFKPFVRFNDTKSSRLLPGTGIGLALSRSLAELHQGKLFIEDYSDYNSFCLLLPILVNDTQQPVVPIVIQNEDLSAKSTILVVEDDPELLAFIVKRLTDYTVITALDGKEALSVLDNNIINLVITDVMMPHMNGFELCRTIKSNIDYSHIPVILLTAKTNLQSKIEGLETGADTYIEKPFSVEYLRACISSLIKNRIKLKETFANSPFIASNSMASTKADEEFLKRMNEIILDNIENPEFNMDDMTEILNMSRSGFYRKIKGILNMSPNEYLRLERLKKAAHLLVTGNNRINEVCYLVGFSSPSYFAKCFQKQFGMLPKDFIHSKKHSDQN